MKKGIRYIISTVFIELLQTARHCAKTLRFTSKKVIKKKKVLQHSGVYSL